MTGQGAATGRWVVAIALAVLCHVPLIWWPWPDPQRPSPMPPLEVTLAPVTAAADHAAASTDDTLDDAAQEEASAAAAKTSPSKTSPSKAPVPQEASPPAQVEASVADKPEDTVAEDDVAKASDASAPKISPRLDQPEPRHDAPSAGQLLQQSFDLAEQPVAPKMSSRVRHLSVAADEQQAEAQVYLSQWRRRVERTGNLNYPEEARRRQLTGGLRLSVVLNLDGTLKQVQVVRSSGYPLLDDAAVRIVRLAAPFPAPPSVLTEGVDALEITRNWQFGKRWQAQ